jgi:hypothetical protein
MLLHKQDSSNSNIDQRDDASSDFTSDVTRKISQPDTVAKSTLVAGDFGERSLLGIANGTMVSIGAMIVLYRLYSVFCSCANAQLYSNQILFA